MNPLKDLHPVVRGFLVSLVAGLVGYLTILGILHLLGENHSNLEVLQFLTMSVVAWAIWALTKDLDIKVFYLLGIIAILFVSFYVVDFYIWNLITFSMLVLISMKLSLKVYGYNLYGIIASLLQVMIIVGASFILVMDSISYSIDEGFMILAAILFAIQGCTLALQVLYLESRGSVSQKLALGVLLRSSTMIVLTAVFTILLFVGTYWNSLGLLDTGYDVSHTDDDKYFQNIEFTPDSKAQPIPSERTYQKDDLIEHLIKRYESQEDPEETFDDLGMLYMLTGEEQYLDTFKEMILDDAEQGKFLDAGGSIKAWQHHVSNRLYFYIRINQMDPDAFNQDERDLITQWITNVNEYSYEVTLADVSYAVLFKQPPIGLYYNQDIGFGMLALMNGVYDLHGYETELIKENNRYIEEYASGWGKTWKNTDDGIVYHHTVWMQNAYLLYEFADVGTPEVARLGFEWMAYLSPVTGGIHPLYNTYDGHSGLETMVIGTYMFEDAGYRYLVDRYLEYDIANDESSDSYIGMDLWTDAVLADVPDMDSVVIYSPVGTNYDPKEIQPDKLVLRELIDGEELVIIVNLRSSGWHRYNGSGSVVSVVYGGRVLLEDNMMTERYYDWIPDGKAAHRDLKITNSELSIYQQRSNGKEQMLYQMTSFDENLGYSNNDNFIYSYETGDSEATVFVADGVELKISIKDSVLKIDYHDNDRVVKPILEERL